MVGRRWHLVLLLRLLRRPAWPALLAGVLLGFGRGEAAQPGADLLASQAGQPVVLEGRIANDPEATAQRVRFVLSVDSVAEPAGDGESRRTVQGRVLVYAFPSAALAASREPPYFRDGDHLRLRGVLERPEPFGDFDYPAYLAAQGIAVTMLPQRTEWLAQSEGNPVQAQVFAVRCPAGCWANKGRCTCWRPWPWCGPTPWSAVWPRRCCAPRSWAPCIWPHWPWGDPAACCLRWPWPSRIRTGSGRPWPASLERRLPAGSRRAVASHPGLPWRLWCRRRRPWRRCLWWPSTSARCHSLLSS
ncbi:MAG: DUF4131 domain-containing protein [Dehalococcoidia bacterium]|nr:DUF4131 domain-containing protein [Dehalococcoidia bacterium]